MSHPPLGWCKGGRVSRGGGDGGEGLQRPLRKNPEMSSWENFKNYFLFLGVSDVAPYAGGQPAFGGTSVFLIPPLYKKQSCHRPHIWFSGLQKHQNLGAEWGGMGGPEIDVAGRSERRFLEHLKGKRRNGQSQKAGNGHQPPKTNKNSKHAHTTN